MSYVTVIFAYFGFDLDLLEAVRIWKLELQV